MAGSGRLVGSVVVLLVAAAWGGGRSQAGDAAKGRQTFVDLQCNACHEVKGESLPPPAVVPAVALGGRMLLPPSDDKLRVYGIGKAHGYALDQGHIKDFIAAAGVGLTSQYLEQFGRRVLGGLLGKAAGKTIGKIGGAATGMAFSSATTYALGQLPSATTPAAGP